MIFSAERRQPRACRASFARLCGVAAFGRAAAGRAKRPDGGGLFLRCKRLRAMADFAEPCEPKAVALAGFAGAIGRRVRYRVS
jgi:hypothetical protein